MNNINFVKKNIGTCSADMDLTDVQANAIERFIKAAMRLYCRGSRRITSITLEKRQEGIEITNPDGTVDTSFKSDPTIELCVHYNCIIHNHERYLQVFIGVNGGVTGYSRRRRKCDGNLSNRILRGINQNMFQE